MLGTGRVTRTCGQDECRAAYKRAYDTEANASRRNEANPVGQAGYDAAALPLAVYDALNDLMTDDPGLSARELRARLLERFPEHDRRLTHAAVGVLWAEWGRENAKPPLGSRRRHERERGGLAQASD